MYAELVIPDMSADNQQVVIPRTALIRGRSLPAVLLVENNSSTLRLVRLGQEMGDGTVIVLSGLMPGQQIVDNPPSGVKSGWLPGRVADKASAH
jgi:hypothetical protein